MNSTLELLAKRRSIRQYDPTPLTQTEKDAILEAAMRAPTAGAMMLYSIIEVEDEKIKLELADTCDHQPFIARAPYLLLFLADYQRWIDLYETAGSVERANQLGIPNRLPGEGDLFLALMDALIAAQTAVVAAESMGIGSCYIGDIVEQYEKHREMFNLPRYTCPAMLVCFGRPLRMPTNPQRPRFERRFIVQKDTYKRFDHDDLNDMFLPFGQTSFEPSEYKNGAQNIVQANYIRKFTSDFSIEMTRSVREILKNWTN